MSGYEVDSAGHVIVDLAAARESPAVRRVIALAHEIVALNSSPKETPVKQSTLADLARVLGELERKCVAIRFILAEDGFTAHAPPEPYALLVDCPGCGRLHAGGHHDTCACDHCAALVPRQVDPEMVQMWGDAFEAAGKPADDPLFNPKGETLTEEEWRTLEAIADGVEDEPR